MAQVTRSEKLQAPKGGMYNQYDKNLNVSTTTSFVNQVIINAVPLRDSVITIHNSGAGDVDFEIVGNPADPRDTIVAPTGTTGISATDRNNGWVILLNGTGSIASGAVPLKQSFTNTWTQVIIRIKHTTTTTTVNIRHRGED